MLITFQSAETDDIKLHGPFNNWKGESMTYNKKIGKFEAYMPVTETLLYKFTKNGEWVLGDYDVVKDKDGNENHSAVFHPKGAEKPSVLKRLSQSIKESVTSTSTSSSFHHKSKDSKAVVVEETVTVTEGIEKDSATEDVTKEPGMLQRMGSKFRKSVSFHDKLPTGEEPTNKNATEIVEKVETDVAVVVVAEEQEQPGMLKRMGSKLKKSTKQPEQPIDDKEKEQPVVVQDDAVEKTETTATDKPAAEEPIQSKETPKLFNRMSNKLEETEVENVTDEKMDKQAVKVPEKVDEKMVIDESDRKESDYQQEDVEKKPTLLKRIKTKWAKLVN